VGFPYQLHQILDDAELHGFQHIVSWLPSEDFFKVHRFKEFEEQIIPRYFKQTRYKSFVKQLNIYKFQRIKTGENMGAYTREHFQRGRMDLCKLINREKVDRRKKEVHVQPKEQVKKQEISTKPPQGTSDLVLGSLMILYRKSPPDIVDEIIATFGHANGSSK
jgi:hypothetical protein